MLKTGDAAFQKQLNGYGLTTAQIFYRLPDQLSLLQQFIWQQYDLCPHFPELERFLDFWVNNLDGPLHSVRIAHQGLIKPAEYRAVGNMISIN